LPETPTATHPDTQPYSPARTSSFGVKGIAALCGVAVFLQSCLLFLVEPMAAKRLLPLLGGAAAVWTTCLVFFQTVLLLGYLCAHQMVAHLRPRAQRYTYIALLLASLLQTAWNLNTRLEATTLHPVLSVLWLLTRLIGLPFLALSATNPLIQAWYVQGFQEHDSPEFLDDSLESSPTRPPYRLFALSNFGSLLALALYPVLLEPFFSLYSQAVGWLLGFSCFILTCLAIVVWLDRTATSPQSQAAEFPAALARPAKPDRPAKNAWQSPGALDRLLWVLLAACGSLLLSAVTNHLSQDVAAIPLLWILPLSMYLLSFVLVFNHEAFYSRLLMLPLLAAVLGGAGYLLYKDQVMTVKFAVALFCGALLIACLFCHGELHRRRPSPAHLTSFYLWIAAGGALGAVFVGVLAPVLFRADYELFYGFILTAVLALVVTWKKGIVSRLFWSAGTVAMVWVLFHVAGDYGRDTIVQLRGFYGVLRVVQTYTELEQTRTLYHGTTEHGNQIFNADFRKTPTTYYGHNSGVGLALDFCCSRRPRRVGVIGLGTGTLAAYGRKGDVFRFYEIDPLVKRIARNVFTYLRESEAEVDLVEGDARLSMEAEPPQGYDVLVIDAFSSDAIPIHLLTEQALALYRRHLQPNGILAFHVSNHYLDLAPVVQQQAQHVGASAVLISSPNQEDQGVYSADWVLVTTDRRFLSRPQVALQKSIGVPSGLRLWTDDYSSLLPILKTGSKEEKKN
jgi:spermidine synthase